MSLKIEVGKVYVDNCKHRHKVLAQIEGAELFVVQECEKTTIRVINSKGNISGGNILFLVREYREPIVHKMWVYFRKGCCGDFLLTTRQNHENAIKDIHRVSEPVEITYTEE